MNLGDLNRRVRAYLEGDEPVSNRNIYFGQDALFEINPGGAAYVWRDASMDEVRIYPRLALDREAAREQLIEPTQRQFMRALMKNAHNEEQQIAYEVLGEALAIIDELQAKLTAYESADHPAGNAPTLGGR
jgi:hypothetical protein